MFLFNKKKEKSISSSDLEIGSIYAKNDKVPSTFVVDKILDFSPAPTHVRLKEQGGNGRTITVALETLKDEHYWHCVSKA